MPDGQIVASVGSTGQAATNAAARTSLMINATLPWDVAGGY